jgi:CubicO group peptidase (beta-lactamase class C family)
VKVSTSSGDVAAQRPMTVQDLLRHTAGLPYGELTQNAAVKDALTQAGLFKPGVIEFDIRDMTGAEQVERLARIPLLYQPGTTWEYSLATDVLGRVVEAASGQRLGDFMSERLFKPLKMSDTGFWVTPARLARVAQPFDKDPLAGTAITLIDVSKQPGNDSGGAGGLATAGACASPRCWGTVACSTVIAC